MDVNDECCIVDTILVKMGGAAWSDCWLSVLLLTEQSFAHAYPEINLK